MLLAFIRLPYSYINQAGSLPQANHRTEQGLLVYPYFDFFFTFSNFFFGNIFLDDFYRRSWNDDVFRRLYKTQ